MAKEKTYTIKKEYKGRESLIEGTLDYLKGYFGYTLEIGRSRNKKIKHPDDIKTINSFLSNLEKSYDEKEAACYERTSIELVC